jgi:phage-related baseplate assembly protein
MADIKSKETLLAELKEFLRAYNRRLDTSDNSLSKDMLLTPFSVGGQVVMDALQLVKDSHILSRDSGADLDAYATNFKKVRLTGAPSTVTVTFYCDAPPTSDVVIPAGTQVGTAGTSFVSALTFSTDSQATFSVTDMASYYNYDRARYEFSVSATCDSSGSGGNIGSQMIVQKITPVTGVTGVTNLTGATGGTDQEVDDDFKVRIQKAETGRDINTVNGLKSYMLDLGFTDAYPIRVENTDSERSNGVDVFVVNTLYKEATDTFTYDSAKEIYYLTNTPAFAITSVVGSGTLSTSKYEAHVDNSTVYRRSIFANDYIRIYPPASLINGEQITVRYSYGDTIRQTQGQLDLNDNQVLTADPVVKRAFPLYFYVNATLTLKENADGPTVRTTVKNALNQWCASFRLGDTLQKSDLTIVLQTGYGDFKVDTVDYVVITNYYLVDEFGTTYTATGEVIPVTHKQYVLYGNAVIV